MRGASKETLERFVIEADARAAANNASDSWYCTGRPHGIAHAAVRGAVDRLTEALREHRTFKRDERPA